MSRIFESPGTDRRQIGSAMVVFHGVSLFGDVSDGENNLPPNLCLFSCGYGSALFLVTAQARDDHTSTL